MNSPTMREALERIEAMCPDTCEMTVAHLMADEARHALSIQALSTPDEQRGAEVCNRCGCSYAVWFAPSPLWNAVMRGGSINGPWKFGEMICPTCFTVLGEQRGIACDWRVSAKIAALPPCTPPHTSAGMER